MGAVTYCRDSGRGLKPDVMYCYDLELSPDFAPRCNDGEVAGFMLQPVEQVESIARVGSRINQTFARELGLEHPDEVYHEIEARLRQTILDHGGSLSHHHGVGKILDIDEGESCVTRTENRDQASAHQAEEGEHLRVSRSVDRRRADDSNVHMAFGGLEYPFLSGPFAGRVRRNPGLSGGQ